MYKKYIYSMIFFLLIFMYEKCDCLKRDWIIGNHCIFRPRRNRTFDVYVSSSREKLLWRFLPWCYRARETINPISSFVALGTLWSSVSSTTTIRYPGPLEIHPRTSYPASTNREGREFLPIISSVFPPPLRLSFFFSIARFPETYSFNTTRFATVQSRFVRN